MTWVAIAAGGALGSLARYAMAGAVHRYAAHGTFPYGIAAVNISGCLCIGVLAGLLASNRVAMPPVWRDFVFVGLLGGFTTFSTFALDTLMLARSQSFGAAALNVSAHIILGLAAVLVGFVLANR